MKQAKLKLFILMANEGYLRKIFPINKWLIVSGKVVIL